MKPFNCISGEVEMNIRKSLDFVKNSEIKSQKSNAHFSIKTHFLNYHKKLTVNVSFPCNSCNSPGRKNDLKGQLRYHKRKIWQYSAAIKLRGWNSHQLGDNFEWQNLGDSSQPLICGLAVVNLHHGLILHQHQSVMHHTIGHNIKNNS